MEEGDSMTYRVNDNSYGEFLVDRNDIILRHGENVYDHLRLHLDDEEGNLAIQLLFLSQTALGRLAMIGIGEAYLDRPTNTTVEIYRRDLLNRLDEEFDE